MNRLPVVDDPRLRLRPMTLAHVDEVLALEQRAYSFPWTRGNFIDALVAGYHGLLLRDADGGLLGYAVSMDGVDEVHLLNLAVAPEHRRRGHARRLLDALAARARAIPAGHLWLEVRAGNEGAQALYRAYGFRAVGVRRGYYPAALGRREDAVVMSLALAPGAPDDAPAPGAADAVD